MKKRRAAIGDVYELTTPAGLAYLQYTHDDGGSLGQLVRVLPGLYAERLANLGALASQQELFFTFYFLDHAVKDGSVRFVANVPIPVRAKPFPIMRRPLAVQDGKVLNWLICDGSLPQTLELLSLPQVIELTPEQRKLSIHSLMFHSTLVDALTRGWTPERDEELTAAARKVMTVAPAESAGRNQVEHFFYFAKKRDAERAAGRLREMELEAAVCKSTDESWLVVAKGAVPIDGDRVERMRDELEAIAAELHGEYDGWGLDLQARTN